MQQYLALGVVLMVLVVVSQGEWEMPVFELPSFNIVINNPLNQIPGPTQVVTEYLSYSASLDITPNSICVNDMVSGLLNTNIPNGACSIFVDDGSGSRFWMNMPLDAAGDASAADRVAIVGRYEFQAVCCDSVGNCRITNTEVLTVAMCPDDGDGGDDGAGDGDPIEWGSCYDYCNSLGYATGRHVSDYTECYAWETGESYSAGGIGISCCCNPEDDTVELYIVCEAIWNPDPFYCSTVGYCEVGECVYFPATLVAPAKCSCYEGVMN